MECLREDTLLALIDGTIGPDERTAVDGHLRGCDACLRLVAASANTTEAGATPPARRGEAKPIAGGFCISRYEIDRAIGAGGMGIVYAARDPELGRRVALKLLRPELDGGGDSRGRVLREAQAMARLTHPNVVAIYDVGTWREQVFIAMELVEGVTLRAWQGAKERSWRELLDVHLRAGRGLAAAHAKGLVHRDFKPENVLVGEGDRVLVTDFGVARFAESEVEVLPAPRPFSGPPLPPPATPSTLTPLGALIGTPAYMSPEQLRGGRADARSDLFAYCTALYEAVAGTRPYPGDSLFALCQRAESGQVEPPLRKLPRWLKRELWRGLRPDPAERHASMDELLAALERGRSQRRARWLAGGAALALAAIAALVALQARKPGPPRSIALLELRDAARNLGSEWLASAFSELLTTELGASPQLRLVPAGAVPPAIAEVGLAKNAPLTAEVALTLQQKLTAELVLSGSYRLADRRVSVELTLFGAGGRALLEVQDAAPLADLVLLAGRLGERLRRATGARKSSSPARVQGSFPQDPQAAALYVQGVAETRGGGSATAIATLKKAEQLAPGNPRILAVLAGMHLSLGAEGPAREAAARASLRKDELPDDERVRLEILRLRTLRDGEHAIELARSHWKEAPDNLERGLMVVREQLMSRKPADALATIAELHKLPPPAGTDFRLDGWEASAAIITGDTALAIAAARRAYEGAEKHANRQAMATARYREAVALQTRGNDPELTRKRLEESIELFRAAGEDIGGLGPQVLLAAVMIQQGDLAGAREKYESALEVYRRIGDRQNEGILLGGLATVLRRQRDLPAALLRASQAQAMYLELGDRRRAAGAQATLGELREDIGDLQGAAVALEQAIATGMAEKQSPLLGAQMALAHVRLVQGHLAQAGKLIAQVRAAVPASGKRLAALVRHYDAELALAAGDAAEAETAAREASTRCEEVRLLDYAAGAAAFLAHALLQQGKLPEARQAISRARALEKSGGVGIAHSRIAVADGRLQAREEPRNPARALATLRAALDQATSEAVVIAQWDARLAIAEIEAARSPGKRGRSALDLVARQARAQGFGLYARWAEAAAAVRR